MLYAVQVLYFKDCRSTNGTLPFRSPALEYINPISGSYLFRLSPIAAGSYDDHRCDFTRATGRNKAGRRWGKEAN
jgi:hypothetical protein